MLVDKLFFATSSRPKVAEVRQILGELCPGLTVLSVVDFPEWEKEVAETGRTYKDNALLKARAYAENPEHLAVFADDSGLEVAALPGQLGVYSNRWHAGTAAQKVEALWEMLRGQTDRRLSYQAVYCLLLPGREPQFFTGELTGRAAEQIYQGGAGFAYDPLFIPDGYEQTLAELGQEVKNRLSHRRQAVEKMAAYLQVA